jgi:uncharacterized protein (TIGR03435 family)
MNTIRILSSLPWFPQISVERLGWTLAHFLWQGTAIAALYAMVRAGVARAGARYAVSCVALALLVAAPPITWTVLQQSQPLPDPAYRIHSIPPTPSATASTVKSPLTALAGSAIPEALPAELWSWVVMFWFIGALAFWIRLAGGWMMAARIRSRLVRPAPPEWQRTLRTLGARMGVTRPLRFVVSALVEAPTVIGWLRPVVLVPVAALGGLPAGHLEAVLAHELAHIRRHDYLVNVVQSIAEALLFYHPAVWWVSGHIRNEREQCCDDAAVAVSGDVLTYARALMELESRRPAHLNAVLAANGGSLSDRIARLLGATAPVRGSLGPSVAVSAVLLIVVTGGAFRLFGQAEAHPSFQVASIKQNTANPPRRGVRTPPGGQLVAENATLQLLILNAYSLQRFQIIGDPSWAETDGYDIVAKAETATDRKGTLLMLQTLLAERFALRVHMETRELPVYELVAAKSGLKLPPPKEDGCITVTEGMPLPPPGPTPVMPCGRPLIGFSGTLNASKITMADFAQGLATIMGRPVLNHTAFTGQFGFHLSFTPEQGAAGLAPPPGLPPSTGVPSAPDPDRPSIFAALQEQLGLRLVSTKGPVEVLVIDHVQRPSEN